MTTYFVSNTGSDSNAGTSTGAPWQTIAGSVNLTGGTKPALNGGDSVLFNGGQTFTGTITMGTTNFGSSPAPSATNPVTFGSYGTGRATISSTNDGFDGTNVGGIIINNLIFTGSGISTAVTIGVFFQNTLGSATYIDYLQINNCLITLYGDMGIEIDSNSSDRGFTNITISGCTIHDCGGFNSNNTNPNSGIHFSSFDASATAASFLNVLITNCTIYNITGGGQNATASGIGIFGTLATNMTIQYCLVHDCGTGNFITSASGPAGILLGPDCLNCTIQWCEVYKMSDGGCNVDGDGYNLTQSTNVTCQYCYSHDNVGCGYLLDNGFNSNNCDATVRYCLSVNDGTSASNIDSAGIATFNENNVVMTLHLYNNTCYSSNGSPGILIGSNPANIVGRVNNNIFYTTTGQSIHNATATSGLTFDGNNYFRTSGFTLLWNNTTFTVFATWKSTATQETVNGGFATDPLLANPGSDPIAGGHVTSATVGYLLKSTSTMINAGLNLYTNFGIYSGSQDFNGVYVPRLGSTGFNVGAMDTSLPTGGVLMGGECL